MCDDSAVHDRSPSPRIVTLVVGERTADGQGKVLGELPPFEVEMPWWQEVAPVVDHAFGAFGAKVDVVRLLDSAGPFPGGAVTYLVEAPDLDRSLLRPTSVELSNDPNRNEYAELGGAARLLDWATDVLDSVGEAMTGRPTQDRSWNLAATWRIETTIGDVWLKATPSFLSHETAVLGALSTTDGAPRLIGGETGRVLMHHVPGRDGYGADAAMMRGAVDTLIKMQNTVDLDRLKNVPSETAATFALRVDALIERHLEELSSADQARLRQLRNELDDRFRAVEHITPTLVHGDLHGGNLRVAEGAPPVILDWGDSFIGSPLFDVFTLDSYSVDGAEQLRPHWLERLGATAENWRTFRPVAALLLPLVYRRFCDNIESAELPYHQADILPALGAALDG